MRHHRILGICAAIAAASGLAGAAGCGDNLTVETPDEPCDPLAEPCTLEATVSTLSIGPGVEDENTCQSWTLHNPTELWVTRVEQSNDGAYHHANWFFVPDDLFALPDGTWRCSDNGFSELGAAIAGGYLFAMSTQSAVEVQELPAGGAVRIPPYSRVIGASHLLNATDREVETSMRLRVSTVPPAQVRARLVPARVQYHDLSLDPRARSSFSTECIIDEVYQQVMGEPMKLEVYYALAHYHALGAYAQLEIAGGPRDGEVLMRHDGYGENFGAAFDPPLDLAAAGARGVRFTCGFDNPRDEEVGWGIGDQEMCVLALHLRTDMGWDGAVADGTGEQVAVAPDGEVQHRGPCAVLAVPWDHDKPGGPPR